MEKSQISAVISSTTKALLEDHVRATGIKKSDLIEEALLNHFMVLQLQDVVPTRITISRRSGEELVKRLMAPPRPTKRLRALMKP